MNSNHIVVSYKYIILYKLLKYNTKFKDLRCEQKYLLTNNLFNRTITNIEIIFEAKFYRKERADTLTVAALFVFQI